MKEEERNTEKAKNKIKILLSSHRYNIAESITRQKHDGFILSQSENLIMYIDTREREMESGAEMKLHPSTLLTEK